MAVPSSDATRSAAISPALMGGPDRRVLLPIALTPLIGRERELALAHSLLQRPEVRLLTLTGAGGIGKTRLALQIAADLEDAAPGSTRVVSLAAVPQVGAVATTLAEALGIGLLGESSLVETLAEALRDAKQVIVLDNFEHLLGAAPLLTDLLAACPGLRFLVTSRAVLRVAGEQVLPVPPLVVPAAGADQSLAETATSPAAQLFTERARAVSGSFALTETTAPMVADICRRLDGVPLAIELAAARVNHLPLPLLRERMGQRLPLLTGGPRDRPLRLQTMRAAIAWSYDFLTAEEQTLLNRLSIFVGGWTLDAAESVCGSISGADDGTVAPELTVLDRLSSLVDNSLVQLLVSPAGVARYAMLETIREFAAERLTASGEMAALARAHAAYFLGLAERLEIVALMPAGLAELGHLEEDRANLLAALAFFDDTGDAPSCLRLADALSWFWNAHSHYREGAEWLSRALAREPDVPEPLRAKPLVGLGHLVMFQGDGARAESLFTEGLTLLQSVGDVSGEALALIGLGAVATHRGDTERATAILNDALAAAERIADPTLAASITGTVYANLGVAAQGAGEYALATSWHERALAVRRAAGYTWGVVRSLRDLGDVARDEGDDAEALRRYRDSLVLALDCGDMRVVSDALDGAASAAVAWGQPMLAARLFAAAEGIREAAGTMILLPADRAAHERAIASTREQLGEEAFAAAKAEGFVLTPEQAIAIVASVAPASTAGETDNRFGLTPREMNVLRLLAAGHPDREIAESLFLSVRTVENHVARIFDKLGVRTRTAAAATAIAAGLVKPDASTPD